MIWPMKGWYPKYMDNSYKSTSKNPSQLDSKMGRSPELTFFQRRHTDGQQAREKMLHIVTNQRNEN